MREWTASIRHFVPASVRRLLGPSRRALRRWRDSYLLPFQNWKAIKRGCNYQYQEHEHAKPPAFIEPSATNALRRFFEERTEGPGIWKWRHYFDIYDRHFQRFRGKEVHVLEIGIYSGGSLEMWRDYFGPKAQIYGVDIEPACRIYEREGVKIFIGDQEDRNFWRDFRQSVPALDIVVDDGGHRPEQQIVTLEELLPFLRPGGVYLCEDVLPKFNIFASYVHGLGHKINDCLPDIICSPFQSAVASIHLYPWVAVLEKHSTPMARLVDEKRGTQWQPFWPGSKSAPPETGAH